MAALPQVHAQNWRACLQCLAPYRSQSVTKRIETCIKAEPEGRSKGERVGSPVTATVSRRAQREPSQSLYSLQAANAESRSDGGRSPPPKSQPGPGAGVAPLSWYLMFLLLRLLLTSVSFKTLAFLRGMSETALPPGDIAGVIIACDVVQLGAVLIFGKVASLSIDAQDSKNLPNWAGIGVIGGLAAFLGLTALSYMLPNQDAQNTEELLGVLRNLDGLPFASVVVSIAIIGPIHEEIFFRGFLLQGVSKFLSVPVAIGASSFIFAASHLLPSEVPALTLLGVILASTSIIGNVNSAIVAHATYNAIVLIMAFQQ